MNLPLQAARLARDLEHIGAITETPGHGSSRPTFTPEWQQARDYVVAEAQAAGCESSIDAAGNVHIRQRAFGWDASAWLSGSHIDSVPHGGKYDGVTGIVVPLEILRAAAEAGATLPLELIIFAEEEGTTFNLGMLGSRAWAGTLSVEDLARLRNRDGHSPLELGMAADRLAAERLDPARYRGLIEVHVEQGPAMWEQNQPLAIVTAINGRRQFAATLRGVANHAGSTPMSYRQDALAGFAEIAAAFEKIPATLSSQTVLTIGQIWNEPNAINVIPDHVRFTADFRTSSNTLLGRGEAEIEVVVREVCQRRRLSLEWRVTETLPALELDARVLDTLRRAAQSPLPETTSGALHDAAILAPYLPTAMIFVASKDGISHNPGEFSRTEDILLAARLLARSLSL